MLNIVVLCGVLSLFVIVGWKLGRNDFAKRRSLPLPPGPKPLPILGNIRDLPKAGEPEWEHWHKHKDLYGPISSVTVLGTTLIILNDYDIATELLDKRASLYSSRPYLPFAGGLCRYDQWIAFRPYNKALRLSRRLVHPILGTQAAAARFNALQEVEVSRFLWRVLETPSHFLQHARTEAGAIILKMAYGYSIEPHGPDPLVDEAEEVLQQVTAATIAGAWLVDVVPALKYLPAWFPGAKFKRYAAKWRKDFFELADKPFKFAKQQMAHGATEPSFVSRLFDRADGKLSAEEEHIAKFDAVSLFGAGADTTVNSVQYFFLAMTNWPEVQRKAQEEIDAVVGTSRLPTFDDRKRLPYVEAVMKETFRWRVVTPLSLPHSTTTDDTFGGWLIPKGAIIIPNVWWFSQDPMVYREPETFNPERFLGDNPEPEPTNYIFGFGRRVCSGKLLADSSVWLTIAKSLAALTIGKALDGNGEVIEPDLRGAPGLISHPHPFKTDIKPRSAAHAALIREVEKVHPWEKSNADELKAFPS